MDKKLIIGSFIILIFFIVGFFSFMESKIEYADFNSASSIEKNCQVKGTWVKDKETRYDSENNQFIFYMIDEKGVEMKVLLDGGRPNNFEMAESVVAKGKVQNGYFHAKDVLTKCPSKYEANGDDFHNDLDQH
jgi:cytochrome c-type biogenesis protein CcmE